MEGKISADGYLYIKRGSRLKKQICMMNNLGDACGDHCPHFGEPEHTTPEMCSQYTAIYLTCGHSKFMRFDTFTDARE